MFVYILILALIISLILLFTRVNFIIEFNTHLYLTIKVLCFKFRIFPNINLQDDIKDSLISGFFGVKKSTSDLYRQFGESLRLKKVKIQSKTATPDHFLTSMLYGATVCAVSAFLAVLDSYFSCVTDVSSVDMGACFNSNQSALKISVELYLTLFSFLFSSTYSFLRRVLTKRSGGKNEQ